ARCPPPVRIRSETFPSCSTPPCAYRIGRHCSPIRTAGNRGNAIFATKVRNGRNVNRDGFTVASVDASSGVERRADKPSLIRAPRRNMPHYCALGGCSVLLHEIALVGVHLDEGGWRSKLGSPVGFRCAEPALQGRANSLAHDELRLRHDGGELAVASGDPRLPNHGGAAAVQWRAFRPQGVAERHCGTAIGFALARG